jgi:hypothetical protein
VWSANRIPLPQLHHQKKEDQLLQARSGCSRIQLGALWIYIITYKLHKTLLYDVTFRLSLQQNTLHTLLRIRRVLLHAFNTSCMVPVVAWAQTLACQLPLKHIRCTKHRLELFLLLGCPILCWIQPSTATAQRQE